MNADDVEYLEASESMCYCNLFAYCEGDPVNNVDCLGYFAIAISTATVALILTVPLFIWYLNIRKYISQGVGVKSILDIFPKVKIKKVTIKSSGKDIPNRLVDEDTGYVDLGKFNNKVKNRSAYKEKGGWSIEKDTAGHGGRKWKLKDKKGRRVASLDGKGKILAD